MAATWAVAWGGLAAIALLFVGALGVRMAKPLQIAIGMEAIVGGALSGILFGAVIMVAERRRTLNELSGRRFVLWGLVAGTIWFGAGALEFWLAPGSVDKWVLAIGAAFGGVMGMATAGVTLRAAKHEPRLARGEGLPELAG
jgi:hypothetical protein